MMELVATREIGENEEVCIDYGSGWDSAWKKYESQWTTTPEDKRYVSATQLNQDIPILNTRTEIESDQAISKELSNVYTACFMKLFDKLKGNATDAASQFDWKYYPTLLEDADNAYRCDVVERMDDGAYTVVLKRSDDVHILVRGVPRDAIRFADKPYTSDLFRRGFRYEIGIPDHLVPPSWRDIPQPTEPMIGSLPPVLSIFAPFSLVVGFSSLVTLAGLISSFILHQVLRKISCRFSCRKGAERTNKSTLPSTSPSVAEDSCKSQPFLRHR
jgi:hypothetical protein